MVIPIIQMRKMRLKKVREVGYGHSASWKAASSTLFIDLFIHTLIKKHLLKSSCSLTLGWALGTQKSSI